MGVAEDYFGRYRYMNIVKLSQVFHFSKAGIIVSEKSFLYFRKLEVFFVIPYFCF